MAKKKNKKKTNVVNKEDIKKVVKKTTTPKKTTTKKKTTTTKKTTSTKTTTPKKTTTTNKPKKQVNKVTTKKKEIIKEENIIKNEEKENIKEQKLDNKEIKNALYYLKKIWDCIKIVLIKIGKFFIFILFAIGRFFKGIWNYLKESDKKDLERRKNRRQKRLAKHDIYNTAQFDAILEDVNDIDRDQLELVSYKGHWNKLGVFLENRGRVLKFDMKKFNKRFKYGTLRDKILILLMLFLIFVFICAILLIGYVIISAPNIDKDRLYKENSTVLYDKNGNEFARIGTENREKVTYDDLPQVLVDAIVATEDSRFFQHNGIDIARFTKASMGQLLGRSDAGGGSTLTMQLSKNSATNSNAHGIKGIIRKFQDIYLAVFVYERQYTKEQIMEFYVNNAYLGAAYGVQQASRAYFGKDVSDLNLAEASMIAGLFQLPYAYNPYNHPSAAEKRRNTVLNLMERHGYISKEEKEAAQAIPIKSLLAGYNSELNEHIRFIDTVVEEVVQRTGYDPYTTSMEIYTTMDPEQQKVVNMVQNGQFSELKSKYKYKNEYSENGIAVVSVADGSISAIGSGRNKKSERSFNYATNGRRHPGSTAKPVVDYGPAMEYLGWGTGNPVVDREYEYTGGGKIKNWDGKYDNSTTVKSALARSRNIPALLTFKQTTNDQKLKMATDLGWTLETAGDTVLETCSIGGFTGVTPLESAAAYAAFARGGTYIEPHSFTKIIFNETGDEFTVNPKKVQAMSEETAYMITNILQYAVTSGVVTVGSVKNTEIASKTGTSTVDQATLDALGIKGSIDGDVWQVSYTQDTVVSLWYSYPTLSKEHYLSQTEGSNSRREIMKVLTANLFKSGVSFNRPSGVTTAEIELETYPVKLASEYTPQNLRSHEIFNKNSVPTEKSERFAQLQNPSNLKYTTNGNQTFLTWDDAALPDAVSEVAIREYFTDNPIYGYWADIYTQERLTYNANYIGNFGYEIYITDGAGTRNLGFVTDHNFTYNGPLSSGTSFTVKSAYSIFKANMSSGITVGITQGGGDPSITPVTNKQLILSLPSCISYNDLKGRLQNHANLKYINGVVIKGSDGATLHNGATSTPETSLELRCSAGKNDQCISEIENGINTSGQYKGTFYATNRNYNSVNQQTVIKNNC